MLTGADDDEAAARDLARPGRTVALKRGEKGSVVFQAGERFEAAAFPVVEVDPTGAGDCYDAAFLVGMLRGWDLSQVARFANAAGALAVTRLGPMEGAPRLDEALALAGIASQ